MKKTRFFLTALLLVTVLTFTGCSNRDNNDPVAGDQQDNTVEQDVNDRTDNVEDDADNLGDDIREGVDDAADDVKDAVDGKDNNNANDSTENKVNDNDRTDNVTNNGTTGQ